MPVWQPRCSITTGDGYSRARSSSRGTMEKVKRSPSVARSMVRPWGLCSDQHCCSQYRNTSEGILRSVHLYAAWFVRTVPATLYVHRTCSLHVCLSCRMAHARVTPTLVAPDVSRQPVDSVPSSLRQPLKTSRSLLSCEHLLSCETPPCSPGRKRWSAALRGAGWPQSGSSTAVSFHMGSIPRRSRRSTAKWSWRHRQSAELIFQLEHAQ